MESTTIERSMFIRRKETDEAFVERGHKQLLLARVVSLLLVVFARVALARTRAAARRHEVAMDPAAVDKATTELGGRRESDSGERERRDRWTTPGGAQWITQRTRVGRRNAGADAQGQTRRGRGGGRDALGGIRGAFTRRLARGGKVGKGGVTAGGAASSKSTDTATHLSRGGGVLATLRARDGGISASRRRFVRRSRA